MNVPLGRFACGTGGASNLIATLLAVGAASSWVQAGDGCPTCPVPMPTAITYQGQLKQAGTPVSGLVDLRFSLWTHASAGDLVAGPLPFASVQTDNGLFTVEVDFGPTAFNGDARWIEVAVCDAPVCTPLSPRQAVTPTPYALQTRGIFVDELNRVGMGTVTPSAPLHIFGESNDFAGVVQAVQTGGSTFGAALYATSELPDGTGLISEANGFGAYAIWGRTDFGFAGVFDGDVDIAGTLSKSAGSFKIDHPLDPENRYLSHSFVESPDMMNVYNGNAVLGADGEVWIELPSYFEALNSDFRYQLTAIGSAGPNLHVAQEVRNNRFRIAGGLPGQKVSWQVTGIRQDAYARQNRIPVEQDKPESERGRYHAPAAYGKSGKFSVHRAQRETHGKAAESRGNAASYAPRE